MNNTKKLRSALLSSLTIIASIVLGHTAQAASLYFENAGEQLDDDPQINEGGIRYNVYDIVPPQNRHKRTIEFKIFITMAGLVDDKVTTGLSYVFAFDQAELEFKGIEKGEEDANKGIKAADVTNKLNSEPRGDVLSYFEVYGGNMRNNDMPLEIKPLDRVHITTIIFNIKALKNDGRVDFGITLAQAKVKEQPEIFREFTYGGIDNPTPRQSQQVEVQEAEVPRTPEPTSILGLFSLGIIGVGATIKRQVKRNHSIEKETTKIG